MGGACSGHGIGTAYNILVGKTEEKRPLERTKCRWEHNIKIDHPGIGYEGMDRIHLAQDRDKLWAVVNTVMNRWVQ
jgi:hypothetical protein